MCWFMSAWTPLIKLYDDMTAQGFASRMAISKGLRYISLRGRSIITESIVRRFVSCSLATKSGATVSDGSNAPHFGQGYTNA